MTATSDPSRPRLAAASRLGSELLVALVLGEASTQPSEWRLSAVAGDKTNVISTRWLDCGPTEDSENLRWVVTARLAPQLIDELEQLELQADGRTWPLAYGESASSPRTFASSLREQVASGKRAAVQAFLARAASEHKMPLSAELAADLASMRDELREQLPRTRLAPGPLSARLEHVIALDERGFWLSGWIHDAAPSEARLVAVSPEGGRGEVRQEAINHHPRPAYSKTLQDDDTVTTLGYHAYVELDAPSQHPRGWVLEFHTAAGDLIEDECSNTVEFETDEVLESIREQLRVDPPDESALEHLVLPVFTRLRGGAHQGQLEDVIEYGQPAATPAVSLVIAVRRADRIEHQLTQFARDPEIRDSELIFVCAEPSAGRELDTTLQELHDLYGIPLRLAKLTKPTLRARGLDLGASVARSDLLILMSGDVFPSEPGWIDRLRTLYESDETIVAVGPKLLYEDDSIAHAGGDYLRRGRPPQWHPHLPYVGLARTLPAACVPRQVYALSDACMMLDARQFRAAGAFTEVYLRGGDEAGDLCLRMADDGGEVWYAPDAELYLLDRTEIPLKRSPASERFNQWLFLRRCGGRLARRLGGDEPRPAAGIPEPSSVRSTGTPRRTRVSGIVSSGRPGAPIDMLEVESPPAADGEVLLDQRILLPGDEPERGLYGDSYAFAITGWALAPRGAPVTVEAHATGAPPWRTVANLPSAAVGKRFPDVPGADACAFQLVIGSLSLSVDFELVLEAVTSEEERVPIGSVRGRRRPVRSGYQPAIQPLIVTMLGRTGSNWVITLLSRHPEILAYSTFVYEPMLASYWTAVLRTLADPASYIQGLVPELYEGDWWTGRERRSPLPLNKPRSEMPRWLGTENPEIVAGFCQSQLDAFYTELAHVEDRPLPRYFVEKCVPGPTPRMVSELYPEGREIVLVRDFRDRICSILDYNARRGLELWGRDTNQTDEEWFQYLRAEAMDLLSSWQERRDHAHLVRYEDVIREPQRTLAGMFAYLDLDASDAIVNETLSRAAELLPEAQRKHQTSSSVEDSVGRWMRDLSPERQAASAEAFDDILVEFGYEPTGKMGRRSRRKAST